jgi:hypothetical protein
MALEAFGSPVVFNAVGTTVVATEQRSIGERLARVVRRELFQEEDRQPINGLYQAANGMVQLLGDDGTVVGVGMVDNSITCGTELHQVKLRPFEIAVHVTHAAEEREWVGEVVGKVLGDCVGKVIRWRRSSICWAHPSEVRTTNTTAREEQNFSFPPVPTPQFDFHDMEENASNSNVEIHSPSERSTTRRSSPMTQESEADTPNMARIEGMSVGTPRRRYSMTNRRARIRTPRERGEFTSQKVTLQSVLCAKETGACKRNCLRDVDAKYVLDQRYMAWGQKYEARATWIMQMLNAFFTRTEGATRDKYVTKLDGIVVCNACYATALGYSQRRFKQLKTTHVVHGRVAAVHGNTCEVRESAKMSAARESLDVFVKEAGDQQPHR